MNDYLLHLVIYLDIYVVMAISLNLIVGYCGLFSLAHAAFYTLGAYAYVLLTISCGASFPLALAGAVATGALSSLLISLPSDRVKGDQFLLLTMVIQVLVYAGLYNWYDQSAPLGSLRNLTNGPYGITGLPDPTVAGYAIVTRSDVAVIATVVMGLSVILVAWLTHSPWGRLLKSCRDDELAARGLGKRVHRARVQSIAIACGLAAAAGALYATYVGYLHPRMCSVDESVMFLTMVLVGGLGNSRGPVVGAALLLLLPEFLRLIDLPTSLAANLRALAFGLLLVLATHFRPQGVAGSYRVE